MALAAKLNDARQILAELSRVRLLKAHENEDGLFPAGSEGTIVLVYGGGEAYEIEFVRPLQGLVTVLADDLEGLLSNKG